MSENVYYDKLLVAQFLLICLSRIILMRHFELNHPFIIIDIIFYTGCPSNIVYFSKNSRKFATFPSPAIGRLLLVVQNITSK